ncbi:hypothetical protein D6764_04770 [Candidatus Woesearchaeota archaeon]|nr:MAG: hypothetical protein D6764_04770 [Candidatus Woesearchaeota archaeon]
MKKRVGRKKGASRKKEKHIIPVGIKVLINYSVLLCFFYALFGLIFPFLFHMEFLVQSPYALVSNILTLGLMLLLIYGFYNRRFWAWKLALFLYTFSILNSVITLVFIKYTILNIIAGFIVSSFIFTVFLNLLTLWYIYERKDYFTVKHYHPHIHLADKVFISSVYIFYFFAIVFVIALGFEFYKSATYTVDRLAYELRGKTYEESMNICNTKAFADRDVCYVTVAASHREFPKARELCSLVKSDFYKLTCYQATM